MVREVRFLGTGRCLVRVVLLALKHDGAVVKLGHHGGG